ncbi:MAG: hypothetical protein H6Q90_5473 [Deltaproteobacteria bacterium]|nr:hypothetical protein [Deltaproteobacteria bacterium]
MQKYLPAWAFGVLSAAGVVLVASMFVNWVDVGGQSATGLGLAWDNMSWLFLVPVVGGLLAASAANRSEHTRLAAIAAGVVVSGDVMFQFAKNLVDSGVDTWLILGGAGVILGGITTTRRSWRVAGGAAVLVGFFAPWDDSSMWRMLTSHELDFLTRGLGITVRILWFVPLAGLVAVASGSSVSARGGRLALVAGATVFGSFVWVIGSAANTVLAWGAWAALGASALALVIGVFAPGSATRPAVAAKA